jgi:hypothetical protein
MITCAVLFALTCNVNGAFAKAESNDLTELFDLLDQYDKESAPVAKLDDDNARIEAFLTSLLNMNDRDLEGFFSRIGNAMKKSGNFAFNRVKQCANNLACRESI